MEWWSWPSQYTGPRLHAATPHAKLLPSMPKCFYWLKVLIFSPSRQGGSTLLPWLYESLWLKGSCSHGVGCWRREGRSWCDTAFQADTQGFCPPWNPLRYGTAQMCYFSNLIKAIFLFIWLEVEKGATMHKHSPPKISNELARWNMRVSPIILRLKLSFVCRLLSCILFSDRKYVEVTYLACLKHASRAVH